MRRVKRLSKNITTRHCEDNSRNLGQFGYFWVEESHTKKAEAINFVNNSSNMNL